MQSDSGLTLAQFRKAQSTIEENYSFLSRSYVLLIINAVFNAAGILIFLIFIDPFDAGIQVSISKHSLTHSLNYLLTHKGTIVFSLAAFAWFGREIIFLLVALFEICKVNEYNILLLDTLQKNDKLLLNGKLTHSYLLTLTYSLTHFTHLQGDGELILLLSIRHPLAFKLGDYIITRQKLLFQILLFGLSSITVFINGVVKHML